MSKPAVTMVKHPCYLCRTPDVGQHKSWGQQDPQGFDTIFIYDLCPTCYVRPDLSEALKDKHTLERVGSYHCFICGIWTEGHGRHIHALFNLKAEGRFWCFCSLHGSGKSGTSEYQAMLTAHLHELEQQPDQPIIVGG